MLRKYILILFLALGLFVAVQSASAAAPPTNGLVGYWNLDEGSGTVANDTSGNNSNGSFVGNPAWVTGKINGALHFDGSSYVAIASNANLKLINFSISAWVKGDHAPGTSYVSQWLGKGSNYIFSWDHTNSSFEKSIAFNNGTAWVIAQINAALMANTWNNITATYDGSSLRVYVNGILDNSISVSTVPAPDNSALLIGNGGGSYFSGTIDEVRIYNRALTTQEISDIYTAGGGTVSVPTINSFIASPSSITTGQSSTLSWSVSGAVSVSITPGSFISSSASGSTAVNPTTTTAYTLTATNASGSVTSMTTVTVSGSSLPTISSFTANPSAITSGQSSTLYWSVANATSLSLDNSIGSVTSLTSKTVAPAVTTTYTLTASNVSGSVTAQTTIKVSTASSSNPSLDVYGGNINLKCSSTTGYFHIQKFANRWTLCDPLGNIFFLNGLSITDPGGNYDTVAISKYGDVGYNWAAQQNRRAQAWGFNTVGELSVGYAWPTASQQPVKMPFMPDISGLSGYAARNVYGYANGPIKDLIYGTNSHYTAWRGGLLDFFDPNHAMWLAGDLANDTYWKPQMNQAYNIGWLIDDIDWVYGFGAGPDFKTIGTDPSNTATGAVGGNASNNANIGYINLITSPIQTFNPDPVGFTPGQYYTDNKVYSKTGMGNPPANCSITTPCSLRDYLYKKYSGNIAALNSAWGSNYTTFDSTAIQVTGEIVGTGNGSITSFSHALAHAPFSPLSLTIKINGVAQGGDCPWWNDSHCFTRNINTGTVQGGAGTTLPAVQPNQYVIADQSCGSCGLPAAYYWAKVYFHYNTPGTISYPSVEVSTSVASGRQIIIYSPDNPDPKATGYDVYVSTRPVGDTSGIGQETLQASNVPFGTNWVEPTSGIIAGASLPPLPSSVNYSNGQLTVTFQTPLPAGAAITVDYNYNGWSSGGTGLMDEDGSHSWVGTNNYCLVSAPATCNGTYLPVVNANANLGADIDAWVAQFAGYYFRTVRNAIKARSPNNLYMGVDTLGSWYVPPHKGVLQACAIYCDVGFTALPNNQAMLDFTAQNLGDLPLINFFDFSSNPDSSMSIYGPGIIGEDFSTQGVRGQFYQNFMTFLLNSKATPTNSYPWMGSVWWASSDFPNERLDWGIISMNDNPYDGKSAIVAPGVDQWGYPTGGEPTNYGNVITPIIAANNSVYTILASQIGVSDTTPPSVPTGLSATAISSSQINLSWTASTDNVGVAGYKIYRGGMQVGTSVTTSYSDSALTASTLYSYTVSAYDAAANNSAQSSPASATTLSASTTPPTISAVNVSPITANGATVIWTTDQSSDSQVEYGTTISYGSSTTLDTTLVNSHSQTLSGLTENTLYHYRVKSKNTVSLSATSTDNTFTTVFTPPVISNIQVTSITDTSATITWITNEPSSSKVNFGSTSLYTLSTVKDTNLVTNHSVSLGGLTQLTTYHFQVESIDSTNLTSTSTDQTFTTTATPILPVISNIQVSNITTTSATVTWTTDQPSNSQGEYGTTASYGSSTTLDSALVTTHSVNLTSLSSGTGYNFRVKSSGSVSVNQIFSTLSQPTPDTTPPAAVTDLSTSNATQTSINLSWTAPGDNGNVGTASSYEMRWQIIPITSSNWNNGFIPTGLPIPQVAGTKQSYIVVGLTPGTTYYFAIKTKDAAGNQSGVSNSVTGQTVTSGSSGGGGYGGGGGGVSITPPSQVKITKTVEADRQVSLEWTNPTDNNFARISIIRKEGNPPVSSQDGFKIFEGNATTYTDINLHNDTTYYFAIYALDLAGNPSQPVIVMGMPKAGVLSFPEETAPSVVPTTSYIPPSLPPIISQFISPYPSGTLVRYSFDQNVYLIENNTKRLVGDPKTLSTLTNNNASKIIVTPYKDALTSYTTGESVTSKDLAVAKTELHPYILKTADSPVVYLVDSQAKTKSPIPSLAVFYSYGFSFNNVTTVPGDALAAYTNGGSLRFQYLPNGNLIKSSDSPNVYTIQNDQKRWIKTYDVFKAYNFNFNNVITQPKEVLDQYQNGSDLAQAGETIVQPAATTTTTPTPVLPKYKDGTLLKGSGPTIYYIENNRKRAFSSQIVFELLSYKTAFVKTVKDSELSNIVTGDPISSIATHPNGTLVRLANDARVYLIDNNQLKWIPSQDVARTKGYDLNQVIIISPQEFNAYKAGEDIK